jgi:hypothetical protein
LPSPYRVRSAQDLPFTRAGLSFVQCGAQPSALRSPTGPRSFGKSVPIGYRASRPHGRLVRAKERPSRSRPAQDLPFTRAGLSFVQCGAQPSALRSPTAAAAKRSEYLTGRADLDHSASRSRSGIERRGRMAVLSVRRNGRHATRFRIGGRERDGRSFARTRRPCGRDARYPIGTAT